MKFPELASPTSGYILVKHKYPASKCSALNDRRNKDDDDAHGQRPALFPTLGSSETLLLLGDSTGKMGVGKLHSLWNVIFSSATFCRVAARMSGVKTQQNLAGHKFHRHL